MKLEARGEQDQTEDLDQQELNVGAGEQREGEEREHACAKDEPERARGRLERRGRRARRDLGAEIGRAEEACRGEGSGPPP